MKITTKRTALSLAVASLFVFTPLVQADQYSGGTTDSFTAADTGYRFYYLYSTNNYGVNPEYGVTYTDVTGITNAITLNFSNVSTTGSTFQVFALQVDDSYGTNSVTTSDITLIIDSADLEGAGGAAGSGGEMYLGAVFNTATGTPGALTIGDITMTATGSTISGDFIGYFQRAGGGETGATVENSGVVNVGNISITSSGTTLGTGIEDAVMAGAYIGYTSGFNVTIGTGTEETPAISVTATDDNESSAVFGMRLRYDGAAGTTSSLTINGDISVLINGEGQADSAEGASTYGFSDDETNSNITTIINGNVSVVVENIDEATEVGSQGISSHRLDGIFESGTNSSLTVNGGVSVTVYGVTESNTSWTGIAEVRGAYVAGTASLTMTGTEGISVYIEGIADISTYVAGLESAGTSTIAGDITVTNISENSDTTSITGDIYGVYQTGGTVSVGNVVVALGGPAANLGDTNSIYGTLSTDGSITVTGTRTLYFGYTTDAQGNPVGAYDLDGNGVAFTSDANSSFVGAFGGFDEVVVTSGSTLYIVSGAETDLGDPTDADGVEASNGTITLAAETAAPSNTPTLTVQSGGTLVVPTIENQAGTVNNSGSITVEVLNSSSGTTISNAANAELYINAVDSTGQNVDSTITGTVTNATNGNIYIGSTGGGGTVYVGGTFTNDGYLTLGDSGAGGAASIVVTGQFNNQYGYFLAWEGNGSVTVAEGGIFNNGANSAGAEFNTLTVNGTFTNATTLIDTGLTTVSGTITNTADDGTPMRLASLTVNSGGEVSGGSITVQTGTLQNETVNNSGTIDVNNLLFPTVINSGELTVEGDLLLGYPSDETTLDPSTSGTFSNSGTADIANLVAQSGSTITNDGDGETTGIISVGSLTSLDTSTGSSIVGVSGVTYTQTSSAHLYITGGQNSGWFTDSILNIEGGYLDASDYADAPEVSRTGQTTSGETTTISGKTLGTNEVNISGTGVVTTEIVDSTTTVTVSTGGSFYVTYIDPLDADATAITLDGGTIFTTLDQIFEESTEIPAIEMEGETDVTIDTELFEAINAVGPIRDTIQQGLIVTDNGGTFSFSDDYSETEASSAVSSLQSTYNNTSVTAVFTGNLVSGSFDVDAANTLIAENDQGYAGGVGVILATVTLVNQQLVDPDEPEVYTGYTHLSIGDTTASDYNVINTPGMGFMDISGADGVVVQNGMKFVLVGDSTTGSYSTRKLLLDADDGGSVDIDGGTFTFGTSGVSTATWGYVNSSTITSAGELKVKNGEFADWTIVNTDGAITIDSTGVLHTNSLTGEAGSVENSGSLIFDSTDSKFEIGTGGFVNKGTSSVLDASNVATTLANGDITNEGTATYQDLQISGVTSANYGTESGGTLTVDSGTHTNSGTSTWDGYVLTGTAVGTNSNSLTVNKTLTVGASTTLANTGTLDASAATTSVTGTLDNDDGKATFGGVIVAEGGKVINSSEMSIAALTTETGSTVTNDTNGTITLSDESSIAGAVTNEGTVTANSTLTIKEGAEVVNAKTVTTKNLTVTGGSFTTSDTLTISDTLEISGGTLDVAKGTFTVDTAALNGGTVYLGSEESMSLDLNLKDTTIGSQVYVANSSQLSFGSGGLDWAESAMSSIGVSTTGSLLVMRSSITMAEGGSIVVGSTSSSDGLYFAGDSTLVVDVNSVGSDIYSSSEGSKASSAVFVTTASGATATIDSGAQLVLVGDLTKEGRYDITQGYSATLNGWTDNFTWGTEDGTVYGLDSSGVGWELAVNTDSDGDVYVVAVKHDDISDNYDVSIPNIVNEDLNDCSSSASASAVCGILRDDSLTKEEKEQAINSMSNLLFAGGVMATAMTDATAAFDSVVNHLTMDSDTFDRDGNLWPWDKSGNLWIDVTGSWQHSKHLEATKISGYKYRANSYGAVIGYDQKLTDRPVVLGAAFSFSDGILKSHGGVSKTKNEYQTYGLSFFGNYSPSPYYNIIGSLHWFHNSADVKQYTSSGKAAAQIQTNLLAVGLRGETTIKAGQVNIVPHVEARYLYGKTSKFTTKLDGTSLWRTNPKGTNTVQFPVGVAFRGDIKTDSGWNVRPRADLSVIPQVGSTKQKSVVWSNGVSDTIDGQFMGKFGGSVKVGFQADKGNTTVGLRYGFLGGTKGRADHSVMLQGRYRF